MKDKVISMLHRYGFWGLCQNMFYKSLSLFGLKIEKKQCFYKNVVSFAKEIKIEYRELYIDDFILNSELNPNWFSNEKIKIIKEAIAIKGNIPYGILDKNLIISYGWISTDYFGLSNEKLQDNDAYLWDDYTHPNYRGRGLHRQLNEIREFELLKIGKRRMLAFVLSYNRASRIGFERCGWTFLNEFYVYSFKNKQSNSTFRYE